MLLRPATNLLGCSPSKAQTDAPNKENEEKDGCAAQT
jgi:hypothetical protein